ncbi:tail assembly protein [Vibrio phage vB_VpaS_KF5]|uniref:Tail assembly protein n=1 Tax=Vibrio phage vB_VpaS_KF5 TaxID=2041476 RepID=A0A384WJY8_9CAUD|nr:hypothetical protein [Vibrio alginolyticus]ATI19356.1 tail assembly protein [Vibrio phage vB_VpaS_KF5]UCW44043.1 tail assembly protein [Vibrio phage F23s1]UYD21450.1 tail assembly chaperone [Vibrio phage 27Ua.3]UYE96266.1 tail assembly chaperone [Vibrio phage 31Fb.4]UYE96342.1 tail assembly chaperone [Vibrio phage 33Fb.4]WGH28621.1 tail assembly protein [Vibrio phage 13KS502A]
MAVQLLWYAVILIVSVIVSVALAPKPPKPDSPQTKDINAPTASENEFIPVAFGTAWLQKPNVCWYGNTGTDEIRKSGGKK